MKAESQARDFLRAHGHPHVERIPAGAEADRGDLSGVYNVTVQVKAYSDVGRACREGVIEALQQQQRANTDWAAVIVRPPGITDPAMWRVVMTLEHWAQVVA